MYKDMPLKDLYNEIIILEKDLEATNSDRIKNRLQKQLDEARSVLQRRVCVE